MEPRPGNILQVIERQARLWELQREEQRRKKKAPEHWPVVAVSREFGARGELLARKIAERIGFSVWDGELVHELAAETGANETVLASLDEHRRRVIEDSIQGVLLGGRYMTGEYLRRLMRLIQTIAVHGRAVIVGRGAEYILESQTALRLRVVCPFDDRVRGYAERQGLSQGKAREKVEREDAERLAFARQHFSRRTSSPSDYDLVVNTGTLDMDGIVGVVLEAYRVKFGKLPASPLADAATSTSAR